MKQKQNTSFLTTVQAHIQRPPMILYSGIAFDIQLSACWEYGAHTYAVKFSHLLILCILCTPQLVSGVSGVRCYRQLLGLPARLSCEKKEMRQETQLFLASCTSIMVVLHREGFRAFFLAQFRADEQE